MIPALNADISGWWYRSAGSVQNSDGRQVAAFNPAVAVQLQVQPPSARDLRFMEFMQMQGVIRTVWMYSNPQGIVRVNQVGNDLLLFPQWAGAPNDTWLVSKPDEGWNVADTGWTKLYATLQTDRAYSLSDSSGLLVLDSNGRIVRTQ
ncbi:MAG: hypothetical protein ACP5P4_05200 [Steroidobacteraceae bacterium]